MVRITQSSCFLFVFCAFLHCATSLQTIWAYDGSCMLFGRSCSHNDINGAQNWTKKWAKKNVSYENQSNPTRLLFLVDRFFLSPIRVYTLSVFIANAYCSVHEYAGAVFDLLFSYMRSPHLIALWYIFCSPFVDDSTFIYLYYLLAVSFGSLASQWCKFLNHNSSIPTPIPRYKSNSIRSNQLLRLDSVESKE